MWIFLRLIQLFNESETSNLYNRLDDDAFFLIKEARNYLGLKYVEKI